MALGQCRVVTFDTLPGPLQSSPFKEADQDHHHRDDQEDMNESTHGVRGDKPQKPQDHQDNCKGFKHVFTFSAVWRNVRRRRRVSTGHRFASCWRTYWPSVRLRTDGTMYRLFLTGGGLGYSAATIATSVNGVEAVRNGITLRPPSLRTGACPSPVTI